MPRAPLLFGLVVALAAVGALFLFRQPPSPVETGRKQNLRVVTTTPVLFSLTAHVFGEDTAVVNLVPPGASPENYALRPQDAEALERADVLVTVGLGFERFLEGIIEQVQHRRAGVVVASEGVETRPAEEGQDPHIWVDPLRAIQMVQNIARGLAVADPARAKEYQRNADATAEQLRVLDAEFRAKLAALPEKRFIAFHPAWGYFAERYGLEQIAVVEEIPGREPTAKELADLIALVRRTGVRVVFSEAQFSPKTVEALARDLKLRVYQVNPEGGDLVLDGYERFMRRNVEVFARALSAP